MMYLVFTPHQPCHLQKWESAGSEHAYYVSSILLQCILPSLIVFIAYYRWRILLKITNMNKLLPNEMCRLDVDTL